MSAKLGIQERSTQSMLCPCCGESVFRSARECDCGARFVGEPLDETPIKVQRLGPAMISVGCWRWSWSRLWSQPSGWPSPAVLVMWSAWRAMQAGQAGRRMVRRLQDRGSHLLGYNRREPGAGYLRHRSYP